MGKIRENGFYWTKIKGEDWRITEWWVDNWYIIGNDGAFNDSDFEKIDEKCVVKEP